MRGVERLKTCIRDIAIVWKTFSSYQGKPDLAGDERVEKLITRQNPSRGKFIFWSEAAVEKIHSKVQTCVFLSQGDSVKCVSENDSQEAK